MHKRIVEQIGGKFCVVVATDGTSAVKELEGRTTVFDEARDFIGCKWLDHVVVQDIAPGVKLEFLVNDNGYSDWDKDPKKVNQIATFLYEGGQKPSHYILGNVVFCLMADGDEGGEFVGMSEDFAGQIKDKIDEEVLPKAKVIVPIPDIVPDPKVNILSFSNIDAMFKYLREDKPIKPTEEQIVFGSDATKKA